MGLPERYIEQELMMFEKKEHYTLQELLQENYTDLDLYREKPLTFKRGRLYLLIRPVSYGEHPAFLKEMGRHVIKYRQIFGELDFLSSSNYKEKSIIQDLTTKVMLFSAGRRYKRFMRETESFILRWGYFAEERNGKIIRTSPSLLAKRRFLSEFQADEIIYILFLMFVFNYDIVKKKTLSFFALFQDENRNSAKRKSSSISKRREFRLPKFSEGPFNKSVWRSLEKRSKMQ